MSWVLLLAALTHFGAYLAIVGGLAKHEPKWHAAVALVVPPLGVWWATRAHMRMRAIVWLVSLAVYVIALGIAKF